jgi:hypothetical protein
MELAIVLALITGLFTLLAALGSQIISTRGSLRVKRVELTYQRKAEVYLDFMVKAGTFGHDPWDESKYVEFLHAYLAALLVASPQVETSLAGEDGVHINAQRLRANREYATMAAIQSGSWLDSMRRAQEAMRRDLQSLTQR